MRARFQMNVVTDHQLAQTCNLTTASSAMAFPKAMKMHATQKVS